MPRSFAASALLLCTIVLTLSAPAAPTHAQPPRPTTAGSLPPDAPALAAPPETTYTSPNAEAQGQFSSQMAGVGDVNGDGISDVIAGAPGERVGEAADAGRTYVISGADGSTLHTIPPPTPRSRFLLGYSVAGVGDTNGDDIPDLVIGAAAGSTLVGRAYLVDGATGDIRHTLHSAHPDSTDRGLFGRYPAGIGDVTGDGSADVVVGAIGEDRAYLYNGADGSLVRTLRSPSPVHDHFGVIAEVGDTNDDGVPDVFVGAPTDSLTEKRIQHAGRGHFLSGASGKHLRTIEAPSPVSNGFFGVNVTSVDAGRESPPNNLLIGASGANRAYLVRGTDGTVRHELSPPEGSPGGEFGTAVAEAGDVNDDGTSDLLVGAPADSVEGASGAGRVHLFDGADGTHLRSWSSPSPTTNGNFGRSLAVVRSVDSSAPIALLVSAQDGDDSAGRIYRFRL